MIEIRELDKDNGRKLWLECFPEDSEEFVSWYFKTVFTEGYGVYDGSELLSMVSIVDATMALRRRPVRANFQRAVATTASARGKGYASMLQKYVLNLLYDRGEGMCSLNTDIHDFYAQFGFSTYVAKELLRIMPSESGRYKLYTSARDIPYSTLGGLSQLYFDELRGRTGWLLRDSQTFERILTSELDFTGNTLIVAFDEKNIVSGYAIGRQEEESFVAYEAIAKPRHWGSLTRGAGDMGLSYFDRPFCGDSGTETGMARIVNVKRIVDNLILEDGECIVGISDPVIEENNDNWHIFSEAGKTKATRTRAMEDISVGIGQFTRWVMGSIDSDAPELFSPCKRSLVDRY